MPPPRHVLILAVDRAQSLDILGPVEVFHTATTLAPEAGYRVELVTPGQAGEVALSNGLALRAGPLPDTPPRHDTLVVAGGVGTGEAVGDAQRTDVDPISRLVSANLHPAAHCTVELRAGWFSHVQP